MSQRQVDQAKRATRFAWAKYYEVQNENHATTVSRVEKMESLPIFVQEEIKSLYIELKKEVECPICYEVIDIGVLKFTKCGHKYCEDCLSKLYECAVCRKKIYTNNFTRVDELD